MGIITEEEMYQKISEQINVTPELIAKEWQELIHINGELVEYIKRVKKKYPVYLLSNAIEPFLTRILKEHDLYPLFDKIFISSEMGIAKPGTEFFLHVLNDLGIDPKDAVMIDDNPSNIAGARAAGIDGIIFTDNESFTKEFEGYYGSI